MDLSSPLVNIMISVLIVSDFVGDFLLYIIDITTAYCRPIVHIIESIQL